MTEPSELSTPQIFRFHALLLLNNVNHLANLLIEYPRFRFLTGAVEFAARGFRTDPRGNPTGVTSDEEHYLEAIRQFEGCLARLDDLPRNPDTAACGHLVHNSIFHLRRIIAAMQKDPAIIIPA